MSHPRLSGPRPAPDPGPSRDHYVEQPAAWVAACCDRGLRHRRNEDATAVAAAAAPGSHAVLVVCDGVSTAPGSDVAALAAAQAARDVLAGVPAGEVPDPAVRAGALAAALVEAAARADGAVATVADGDDPPACTFAAAVTDGDLVVSGVVGDSRVYWLPDLGRGDALQLGADDSVASLRIALGVERTAAEHGPQAHAITRWLGPGSPDPVPQPSSVAVTVPGWLLVCSDGLWNYCSEPADLQALLARLGAADQAPLALATALVDWANAAGGRDNIAVALARLGR